MRSKCKVCYILVMSDLSIYLGIYHVLNVYAL